MLILHNKHYASTLDIMELVKRSQELLMWLSLMQQTLDQQVLGLNPICVMDCLPELEDLQLLCNNYPAHMTKFLECKYLSALMSSFTVYSHGS